ncbi:MAG: hypothetical protein EA350_02580 [Gemmatimonadales bacterium]|nr:MAG: hypothetical protein EA350_02580 [Gemmatimonadales bacterium]
MHRPAHAPVRPPWFAPAGLLRILLLLPFFLAWGCGGAGESGEPDSGPPPDGEFPDEIPPAPSPEGAAPEVGAEHLRVLTFVSLPGDSATVLPWSFRSIIADEGTLRHREASLGRGGEWEALLADTLVTPLTRFPWRILPGGPVRMTVGSGDALQSLVFDDPPRQVELVPGEFLAEWVPEAGSVWRIHRSRLVLPSGEVNGLMLDLTRSRGPGSAPSLDWMFLHGGPGTQVLLREPPGATERERGPWLAWSRVAFQERDWSGVEVRWAQVRPMERARRDVPMEWRLQLVRPAVGEGEPTTPFEGELRVVRSLLTVEEGPGPILPVAGYFEVEGEIRVLGERLPVRGIVRHRQP